MNEDCVIPRDYPINRDAYDLANRIEDYLKKAGNMPLAERAVLETAIIILEKKNG